MPFTIDESRFAALDHASVQELNARVETVIHELSPPLAEFLRAVVAARREQLRGAEGAVAPPVPFAEWSNREAGEALVALQLLTYHASDEALGLFLDDLMRGAAHDVRRRLSR